MRTALIVVERVGRCVGGMLANLPGTPKIAPQLDPHTMMTAIPAMEMESARRRVGNTMRVTKV